MEILSNSFANYIFIDIPDNKWIKFVCIRLSPTAAFIDCGRKPFAAIICSKFAQRLRGNMRQMNMAQDIWRTPRIPLGVAQPLPGLRCQWVF